MDKKSLSANDICRIIKTCKDSGVRTLEVGELKLSFDALNPVVNNNFNEENETLTSDGIAVTEKTIDDTEDTLLMVDDPEEYEHVQVSRQLERQRLKHEASLAR